MWSPCSTHGDVRRWVNKVRLVWPTIGKKLESIIKEEVPSCWKKVIHNQIVSTWIYEIQIMLDKCVQILWGYWWTPATICRCTLLTLCIIVLASATILITLVYLCSIFFLRSHSHVVISFVFPMFVLLELQLVILVHLWQCDTDFLWSLRLACQYIVRMYSSGFLHFPMWILQSNTSIQLTQSGPINMHGHPAYGPVPALQKIIGWFCPHSQPNSAHPY